jgi:hypothetical protein
MQSNFVRTVFLFSKEDGQFWLESKEAFSTLTTAIKSARDHFAEGYIVVVYQDDTLFAYGGMTESDAMRHGTNTVNRLTKKAKNVEYIF